MAVINGLTLWYANPILTEVSIWTIMASFTTWLAFFIYAFKSIWTISPWLTMNLWVAIVFCAAFRTIWAYVNCITSYPKNAFSMKAKLIEWTFLLWRTRHCQVIAGIEHAANSTESTHNLNTTTTLDTSNTLGATEHGSNDNNASVKTAEVVKADKLMSISCFSSYSKLLSVTACVLLAVSKFCT